MAFVLIPLRFGKNHLDLSPKALWQEGAWTHESDANSELGVNSARVSFPLPLLKFMRESQSYHLSGFSKLKADKFRLHAIEVVQFKNEKIKLNPIAILHIGELGGSSSLNIFDAFGENARNILQRFGLNLEAFELATRPLSVTNAPKVKSQKTSIISLIGVDDYRFRTQALEFSLVGFIQNLAVKYLKDQVPVNVEDSAQVNNYINKISEFKTILWWKYLAVRYPDSNPLDLINTTYRIEGQAKELFDLADDLREVENLKTSQRLNKFGAIFAGSSVLAGWLAQGDRKVTLLGLFGTLVAVALVHRFLKK